MQLRFSVRSTSHDGVYDVAASRSGQAIMITCTCEAGRNGQHCKHRIALIEGDMKDLVSGNPGDVEQLRGMIEGSELLARLNAVRAIERNIETAKRDLSKAKAALARVMLGG